MEKWLQFQVMESIDFSALKVFENTGNEVLLRPPRIQGFTVSRHFFSWRLIAQVKHEPIPKKFFFRAIQGLNTPTSQPLQFDQAIKSKMEQVISFIWHFHELFYIL